MRRLTHAEFLAMKRFGGLDGLRAIAAVLVIFFHVGGPQSKFLSGWIGVHTFFVLSGFLITTLMLREKDKTGRISLRDFYLRRIFRIVPLYYLGLLITVITAYKSGLRWSLLKDHLTHYVGFMNEYDLAAGTPYLHTWTIGIEQKFYLVWPLLLVLAGMASTKLRIPLAITAIVLVLIPYTDPSRGVGIHYSVLLIGALLAVVLHLPRGFALLSPLTHPVVGAVTGVGFVLLHLSVPRLTAYFGSEPPAVFLYGIGVALLLPTVLGPSLGRWLLSRRPMVFIGERSYAIYLLQSLAFSITATVIPWLPRATPIFALAGTVVAVLIADLAHRRLEVPMIDLGRRLIKRLDDRADRDRPTVVESPQPVLANS